MVETGRIATAAIIDPLYSPGGVNVCTTIQCVVPWAHTSLRPNSNRYTLVTMTLLIYIIFYIYFDRSSTFAGLTVASNMPKSYALNVF